MQREASRVFKVAILMTSVWALVLVDVGRENTDMENFKNRKQ